MVVRGGGGVCRCDSWCATECTFLLLCLWNRVFLAVMSYQVVNRGCYMAVRWYEISLRVLKIFHEWVQRTSEILFQHEKRNFVSPSGRVMFYLLYKHQWTTKPFHFNSFWCERCDLVCNHSNGDIFTHEDNMLFSHVKISSFRAKSHLVFHWCLYNKIIYLDHRIQGSWKSHSVVQDLQILLGK